jgi:hypothetical protein
MVRDEQIRHHTPAEIKTAVRPAPATLNAIQRVLFGLGGLCEMNIQDGPKGKTFGTYHVTRNLTVV